MIRWWLSRIASACTCGPRPASTTSPQTAGSSAARIASAPATPRQPRLAAQRWPRAAAARRRRWRARGRPRRSRRTRRLCCWGADRLPARATCRRCPCTRVRQEMRGRAGGRLSRAQPRRRHALQQASQQAKRAVSTDPPVGQEESVGGGAGVVLQHNAVHLEPRHVGQLRLRQPGRQLRRPRACREWVQSSPAALRGRALLHMPTLRHANTMPAAAALFLTPRI